MPQNRGWSGMPRAEKRVDEWPGDEKVREALSNADEDTRPWMDHVILAAALRAKQEECLLLAEQATENDSTFMAAMDRAKAAEKEAEGR